MKTICVASATGGTGKSLVAAVLGKILPETILADLSFSQGGLRTYAGGEPFRIMEHSNLGPKDDVKLLAGELKGIAHNIVVTGHLPFLAGLAGFMLTGNLDAEPVDFRNSGVVCLERNEDGWILKWAMTPELVPQ